VVAQDLHQQWASIQDTDASVFGRTITPFQTETTSPALPTQIARHLFMSLAGSRRPPKGCLDASGVDYVYDLADKITQVSNPTTQYFFCLESLTQTLMAMTPPRIARKFPVPDGPHG
jgi:hypothetical protein